MFKVSSKDTRRSGVFIVDFKTYFTPCSSVSSVNFEQVKSGWIPFLIQFIFSRKSFFHGADRFFKISAQSQISRTNFLIGSKINVLILKATYTIGKPIKNLAKNVKSLI